MPPRTGAAIGRMISAPVPVAHNIGASPMIVVGQRFRLEFFGDGFGFESRESFVQKQRDRFVEQLPVELVNPFDPPAVLFLFDGRE